jgi:hypothetical protein
MLAGLRGPIGWACGAGKAGQGRRLVSWACGGAGPAGRVCMGQMGGGGGAGLVAAAGPVGKEQLRVGLAGEEGRKRGGWPK